MIPVTLVRLDNYTGFLGSFDNVNWWKSQPIPGAVDYVNDAVWVYGQYHVCSAKMIDGTYSIFRSTDNGFSWSEVLNIEEVINTIICPDYGVVLAATSGGWWKSYKDSGLTWVKISTDAPNCFCVKELTQDILVALSRDGVWRSTNGGISWTKTYTAASNAPFIYPSIDGTYYDCIVGISPLSDHPYFIYSDSGGLYWESVEVNRLPNQWTSDNSTRKAITNIVLTATFKQTSDPNNTNVPTFVVQCLMSNGLLRHYYFERQPTTSTFWWKVSARFDAYSSIKSSLFSDESQVTGSTNINRVVIFTGTDGTSPLMKKSIDCGYTWTDINIMNATLYSGPDLSQVSGNTSSFIDDTYFSATWSHATCHNYWKVSGIFYEKNQSYDMDFITPITRDLPKYNFDIIIALERTKAISLDYLSKRIQEKEIPFDIVAKTINDKPFRSFMFLLKGVDKGVSMDIYNILRLTKGIPFDSLVMKTVTKNLIHDILIKKFDIDNMYSMDISIDETIVFDILHNSEKYSLQLPAIGIGYKNRAYDIFNSRKVTKK
jgi:hypothetical protein